MPNSYDLHRKSAIVTGGAKSIGKAIAELLVASGANVWIWDANAAQVPGTSSDVVDVTNPAGIEAALARLPNPEMPDILINSAGYLGKTQSFVAHPDEDWQRIVAVNLMGTLRVTQAVLPRMLRAGNGRIVNLGSLAASAGVIAFTNDRGVAHDAAHVGDAGADLGERRCPRRRGGVGATRASSFHCRSAFRARTRIRCCWPARAVRRSSDRPTTKRLTLSAQGGDLLLTPVPQTEPAGP
jgi:NAD(P)-dependent dehydrogenase (short-subunit alcohol dehydrogenase family)